MLRERGKGCIFSAAYQGKVRETAQMILEASALCFAQASHSMPRPPTNYRQGWEGAADGADRSGCEA